MTDFSEFGLGVHFIDEVLILFLSDLSLEFQCGSEFTAVNAEVDWEKFPFSNVCGPRHRFLVSLFEALLDELLNLFIGDGFIRCFDIDSEVVFEESFAIRGQVVRWDALGHIHINLECNECTEEFLILTDDHNVRARRAIFFEVVLNNQRCDIFSSSCDDQLLYSSCNEEEAVLVNLAQIARAKISLAIDSLPGGLFILEVAHHDVPASENDLTIALFIWVINLEVSAT